LPTLFYPGQLFFLPLFNRLIIAMHRMVRTSNSAGSLD
jgi:hypothetical protein